MVSRGNYPQMAELFRLVSQTIAYPDMWVGAWQNNHPTYLRFQVAGLRSLSSMGGQTPLQNIQEMKDSAVSLEMPGATDGGAQQGANKRHPVRRCVWKWGIAPRKMPSDEENYNSPVDLRLPFLYYIYISPI